MRKVKIRLLWAGFCLLLALQFAGCVSSEKFYGEVEASRQSAYRRWKNGRDNQKQTEAVISGAVTMQDCLKLALTNNKTLQRIVQEKEFARGERLKSYSAILPSVAVSADYLRKDKVASIGIPGGGLTITMGDVDNYSAALVVTQPLFAGGSIPARINAARLFSLLADETVRSAVENLIFEASRGYYDVLLNQHLYEISADAVRLAQANLDNANQKRRAGVASDFDVLRVEVELSNFQAELIRNRNAIKVAKASLLKVMGISQDSDYTLSDKLVYVPLNVPMEQAVETAYRNRPDLYGSEIDIKLQQERLKIARSRYWPVISGFYQTTRSKPDPHNATVIDWGKAWNAGISATLPVFDGLAREGEIVQQKAILKQSQIDLIDAEETALFELTRALFSIQDANEFVESQRLNLVRAQEGLRLAEVGYREGTNTQLETIDAQSALTTARANYYQAIYSHVVAKLALQKAMGVLAKYEPVSTGGDLAWPETKDDSRAVPASSSVKAEQELTK
ncbi:MAG TPA: TolC family protein [Sedimentisphaerales bacterium]|nr:TolC family protein [Sedimentisphaerales bacterium]